MNRGGYRCRPCRKNHGDNCGTKAYKVGGCKERHGRAIGCKGRAYKRHGCAAVKVA